MLLKISTSNLARSLVKRMLSFFILFSVQHASGQLKDTLQEPVHEKWVAELDDFIGLKLSVSNYIETFSINIHNNTYTLYPNTSNVARLFFNYRSISLYYTYVPLFLPGNNDDDTKGETKSTGYGAEFTFDKIATQLSYTRTSGYYLKNTIDYYSDWKAGDDYYIFPNLVTKSLTGETSYKFNENFSQAAVSSQTARQLKSAGSFIPRFIYRYYVTESEDVGTAQRSQNLQLIVGAGYYYTYVLKKQFYVSAGVTPAFGYMGTWLKNNEAGNDALIKKNIPIGQISGQAGLGYNGRLFYAGAYWSGSSAGYKPKNATAVNTNSTLFYQFFVGYRLKAPKFLAKSYDYVMDALLK